MGADAVSVDANVLVYANVASAPFHVEALAALERLRASGAPRWISRQTIREFLAVRSRPQEWASPTSPDVLVERVRFFEAEFRVADETAAVTERLLDLLARHTVGGKQIHDANVVATMLAHGVPRLLTHNVADFRRYAGEVAVVPLVP